MIFSYDELDDLDSAIGDSSSMIEDDWRGAGIVPLETREYLRRLDALREKIGKEMMERRPSTATTSTTTPEKQDEA